MAGPEGVVAEDHLVRHQRVLADVAGDLGKLDHAVQHRVVAPGVRLLLQPVDQPAEFGRLAQHVLGRQHAELDLVDRQQVLDVLDLGDGILDLAVDHVLDGQRVDGAAVPGHEFVDQLRVLENAVCTTGRSICAGVRMMKRRLTSLGSRYW